MIGYSVSQSLVFLLLIGLSVCQSKSESGRNGILMNGTNEAEDSNTAKADDSIDKTVTQPSVDDVNRPLDSSSRQLQIPAYFAQFLKDHPQVKEVRPSNKKDNSNESFIYTFSTPQNIEVVIHLLDINQYSNFLTISSSSATVGKMTFNFTENLSPPKIKKIVLNSVRELSIFLEFANSEWSRYRGFVITYQSLDDSQAIEKVAVNSSENAYGTNTSKQVNILHILIVVNKSKQVNETWNAFRRLLANSTNKFINSTSLNVETCSEDNVKLNDISACQTVWKNSINCVQIGFSIPLKTKKMQTVEQVSAANQSMVEIDDAELSDEHLIMMWIQFGRQEFADNGYQEFEVPDTKKLLLLWTSISLAIIGAFILVLIAIWKMDILRDYRRMYWKNADDEKQISKPNDTDISMYPTAHQIVPTLFPNELAHSNNVTNALPFEFVNKPITYNISDFKRRPSLEESLKPNGNVKRKAGEVPFQCDTEFNETKQDHPEDEVYFNNSSSTSPRLVN